jgi:glycosyltransferase involved in cell wall biosynthesis
VPIVATRAGSIPEVAGDAALLVPARDAAALADALRRLLDSPALRAELREKGLRRARERFAPEVIRPQVARWFERQ